MRTQNGIQIFSIGNDLPVYRDKLIAKLKSLFIQSPLFASFGGINVIEYQGLLKESPNERIFQPVICLKQGRDKDQHSDGLIHKDKRLHESAYDRINSVGLFHDSKERT